MCVAECAVMVELFNGINVHRPWACNIFLCKTTRATIVRSWHIYTGNPNLYNLICNMILMRFIVGSSGICAMRVTVC